MIFFFLQEIFKVLNGNGIFIYSLDSWNQNNPNVAYNSIYNPEASTQSPYSSDSIYFDAQQKILNQPSNPFPTLSPTFQFTTSNPQQILFPGQQTNDYNAPQSVPSRVNAEDAPDEELTIYIDENGLFQVTKKNETPISDKVDAVPNDRFGKQTSETSPKFYDGLPVFTD